MTFWKRVQMEFYTKNGSDLCWIYGNESWNDRSSCLDIKLEINNNALWMGIDCNWDYAISSLGVSRSSQRKIKILQLCKPKHILKKFREPSRSSWGEAICSQNICEYWGGVGKLAGWCNPRWQKIVMHYLKSVLLYHSFLCNLYWCSLCLCVIGTQCFWTTQALQPHDERPEWPIKSVHSSW